MKRMKIALLLAAMALLLAGCSTNDRVILNNTDIVITATYDSDGTLIQRSEYNRKTNITTSYIYMQTEDNPIVKIVTVDSEGNIVCSEKFGTEGGR